MSMGDGGVACMPSQHVMERLPISDTYCRGNGGYSSKSLQFTEQQQRKHENKMVVVEEEEFCSEFEKSESSFNKEIEKGEIVSVSVSVSDKQQQKEEVEEGELSLTVEVENGEFIPEKLRKREVEKGEFIPGKWGRGEVERGEFIPDKRQKWEVERERGEYCQERRPKWESERGDFSTGRRLTSEVEKGEFVPEKWRRRGQQQHQQQQQQQQRLELERGEFVPYKPGVKEDFGLVKGPKQDLERDDFGYENGRAADRDRTSASAKSTDEDNYKRKELSRSGSEWTKRYSRWDPGYSRDTKVGYRAAEDDLGSFKRETNDAKSYNKDYSNTSWQKRQGTDSGNNPRRYHGDFADHQNSKNRRFYEDNNRPGYSDKHHSLTPSEKPFRNASSSRISSSNRYSSKHYDSSVSTRPHDRHGPSPGYFERSPHDRNRHREQQQQQQRSPVSERSPSYYDHRTRSPLRRSPHRVRHYDRRDHSPGYLDRSPLARGRSPHVRARHHDRRDRTPGYFDVSPRHDLRDRTPGYLEKSPPDCDPSPSVQVRQRNCRDRTPGHFDRSPTDQGQPHDYQVDGRTRKAKGEELISADELDHEPKLGPMDSTPKDLGERSSSRHAQFSVGHDNDTHSATTNLNGGGKPPHGSISCTGPPHVIEVAEEVCMEEDMDISNTPPHPTVDDSALGTWSYLDQYGIEQGPSKLCNLKRLVEEGYLQPDHLIKHSGSDWWVTVENAASPLVPRNFPPIVSDTVSQLVSPPEAPGNLLEDAGESAMQVDQEPLVASLQLQSHSDDSSNALQLPEDLHIDDRVNALLKGYSVTPGKELETLGEALNMVFEHTDWERWGNPEGFTASRTCTWEPHGHQRDGELNRLNEILSNDILDNGSIAPCNKDYAFPICDSGDWFSGRWSCKGGDWRRNDDVNQDKSCRRKLVLNDGYPLCQMPKYRCDDPRWSRKDELYYPSRSRKLNLPSWAFTSTEEKNDSSGTSRSSQIKAPPTQRGLKGTMLPVVRINACVVNNQASLVPEPRAMVRGNERYSSRTSRSFSLDNNGRSLSAECPSQPRRASEKCIEPIITPKDHVCSVNELQLHLGDWYYLDGAGREHGPSSFGELQALAEKGTIQKDTSVFRKSDNLWVPVNSVAVSSKASVDTQDQEAALVADHPAVLPSLSEVSRPGVAGCSSSFNHIHPQFIGYTRGKLHELVMKSFKSREFAAAINEVLDPWINAKQPKKELESIQKFRRSEDDHIRAGKRTRAVVGDSEDDYDLEGDLYRSSKDDSSFDDLCDASFAQEINTGPEAKMEGWGLLDGYILARVFHFLRADMKSLAVSASTCRHWNTAVKFYRDISKQVDFSEAGPDCSDSMFQKIMSCYNNSKIASLILIGCTNITAHGLEEILRSFPCISSIDIRGCMQFRELIQKYQNIKWINSRSLRETKIPEDSYSKIRTLKQITERGHSFSKAFKGSSSHLNEFHEGDLLQYDPSLDGRDSTNRSFQQSSFKRKKLLDSRNSSSLLSRDARIRHFLYRKSENGYKRMEEFLAFSLKDIMKENTFDFFIPRVAEIEDKMKSGYYKGRGLNSVKEDISRMCRDAIKAKSRGDARDMNHIIMLFIRLATSLEENANKSSRERDELLRMLKDKSKKKQFRTLNERKTMSRSNGAVYFNGGLDYGEYASDREVRRRLSKLNKRPLDSESETSDDHNHSSENTGDDSETTVSDTESDRDFRSEGGMRDGYFLDDEALDSTIEDREWGARMTKASLVPPVTRKYEVIDRYVITVDEDEVQRKMRVSLPEDYVEKLNAQKNGESDMEIPEVKDYKPRKQLGEEVLEQEVYGIDPYTHNLLLDSMPEELDWPLADKHVFIEDTLLRALNMQVRHFTGTGNAPMKYPLQPVVEEIQTKSEEDDDKRTMKMCQGILKAMRSRPEENYVAYRKGLGVVCNKEEGFGSDDFVVEFLGEVYPAWKWFEKQDGIKFFQKNNKDPAPEFYNIYLERPKGDRDGYDLVVVDAMHKANYASRICHSCRPNCEAKVTAVDGQYQIGVYTVRPIGHAEEITFDYNSVTESKEEYEASVCLCGSQICRGSYLNLTGEGAYQKILMECHGLLNRHQLMLEACELNFVSEEDYNVLGRAGLGTCLLDGLPPWLVAYSARLVRFINFERTKLPEEIFRRNLEEKRKFFSDISIEYERNDAEVQADGVYNSRLQNLALTLDKVRYVMRSVYHDPKRAPPPLRKLTSEEVVSVLWKGEGSLVEELLECMAPHTEDSLLNALKSRIQDHDPSGSDNLMGEVKKSLLWLRDEVRDLPCTYKCRHDAAADLIHIYAYTKCFFRVQEYKTLTSPPVYISPLDVGPKYADKFGSGLKEYCKKYGENYCLGQLINWNSQNADPDCCLSKARRGCLSLPEIASFYAKANKPSRQRVYGPRTLRFMLSRMEKQPQRPWPKEKIWSFKGATQVFGSPMLDAVVNKSPLDKEMVHWLKSRPPIFQAKWDR